MVGMVYRKTSVFAYRRIYPIAEVARRSGWPDPNFFARTFRAHTGRSPTEWRRQFGEAEAWSDAAMAL